jgi:hypothetical protein
MPLCGLDHRLPPRPPKVLEPRPLFVPIWCPLWLMPMCIPSWLDSPCRAPAQRVPGFYRNHLVQKQFNIDSIRGFLVVKVELCSRLHYWWQSTSPTCKICSYRMQFQPYRASKQWN